MKLHEIITANDTGIKSILIEKIIPYKKSLIAYYSAQYNSEPLLLVTSVSNAAQYGIICPITEAYEAIHTYFDGTVTDEEMESEIEEILFNSIPLSKL